jgi:hypothetical protein
MNVRAIINRVCVPIIFVGSFGISLADEKTDEGVKTAKAWVAIVDAKDYQKSWDEAAPFFKGKVTAETWKKMADAVREPLGEVASRELLNAQFSKQLPGAPEGEYVVVQFKTSFANKKDAVETVVPMKDDKGVWRVSGYFVK